MIWSIRFILRKCQPSAFFFLCRDGYVKSHQEINYNFKSIFLYYLADAELFQYIIMLVSMEKHSLLIDYL